MVSHQLFHLIFGICCDVFNSFFGVISQFGHVGISTSHIAPSLKFGFEFFSYGTWIRLARLPFNQLEVALFWERAYFGDWGGSLYSEMYCLSE